MRALNYKERRKGIVSFSLVFFSLLFIFFLCCYFTIQTGRRGVDVLEKRHSEYVEIFKKQAAFSYEMDNMIKQLYQLKRKNRTLSQHKQFQEIISGLRDEINEEIKNHPKQESFKVYSGMLVHIKEIQAIMDKFEEDNEEYQYYNDLLSKCIEKYQEEARKKK